MELPKLDARLACAAEFVREGAVVADVGSDHAYLPVCLVLSGRAVRAVAGDVRPGPVARAKQSVIKYGAQDKIDVVLRDGLAGMEELPLTDIVIAGMGGELIAAILERAPWVQNAKYRLILQPMTHPECLRKYLFDNGFDIVDEALCPEPETGRIYQILCAEYTGEKQTASEAELWLGKKNLARGGDTLFLLAQKLKALNQEICKTKEKAGRKAPKETALLASLAKHGF